MATDGRTAYEEERKRVQVAAAKRKAADAVSRETHSEVSLRIEGTHEGPKLMLIVYRPVRGGKRDMVVLEQVVWRTDRYSEGDILSWGVRALMRHAAIQLELPFEE